MTRRSVLIAALEQRTAQRDHALQLVRDTSETLNRTLRDLIAARNELTQVRAERDEARRLAGDLWRQSGWGSTMREITELPEKR